jgi:hypothetical protein
LVPPEGKKNRVENKIPKILLLGLKSPHRETSKNAMKKIDINFFLKTCFGVFEFHHRKRPKKCDKKIKEYTIKK